MAYGHGDAAKEDGLIITPETVGYVATDERGEVDETSVGAVDLRGCRAVEESGHEVEDEEGPHAVVAETLGHARGKDEVQTAGVGLCRHR